MDIFVNLFSKKTYKIHVSFEETISNLKAKIQACENISMENTSLIFAGNVLDDESRISAYNISNESTLYLVHNREKITINIKSKNGRKINLKIDSDELIEDIKVKHVENVVSVPLVQIRRLH